ncbi:hypothetical protein BDD12DRAFT_839733 [Trichophaea hybrida]|nr:hypothetical protein BDD12DRAFT_839733 [Trichophaea hybrida]
MHKKYSTGRNQMNPFHHLHLNGERGKTDIRGFEIAVFFRHDVSSKKATVICINFHSLGRQPVEEVQHRILHTLEAGGNDMMDRNPFWVHLVYVSIVLRWWKTAMGFFEEGLICHEKRIEAKMMAQSEENAGTATRGDTVETNRSLHAMTAHSLRYETELAAIKSVVLELIQQHEELASLLQLGTHEKERVSRALKQQLAEVNSVAQKQRELAKKAKNTIALLFHSVQADYDQQQVSNGTDLQQILRLGRNDAVNTFELALQTKNDSFAMKTIAIMTMAFLPGTSFAAVLALPYFQGSSTKRTLWIWAILSGTFTIVIFVLFRWLWSKRSTKKLWNPATEEI